MSLETLRAGIRAPLPEKPYVSNVIGIIFFFFRSLYYKLAKFKTSNCSGQRGLSSALPVRRTVSQGRGVGAYIQSSDGLDFIGYHFLSSIIIFKVQVSGDPSRGFLCSQVAAEHGSSMGGAVIGGWVLRAPPLVVFVYYLVPPFWGASTHFASTFLL